jgi:uncharacterized integral membrane protein
MAGKSIPMQYIYAKWAGIALIILIAVTFALKNSQPTTMSYYLIGEFVLPLYALVALCVLLGIAMGVVLAMVAKRNKKASQIESEKD